MKGFCGAPGGNGGGSGSAGGDGGGLDPLLLLLPLLLPLLPPPRLIGGRGGKGDARDFGGERDASEGIGGED